MNFDDGARRIRPLPPKLFLDLVYDRAEAIHVRDVDHETCRIAQGRALGFGNQLHICKSLTYARFVALDLEIGFRVDATHAGDVDEVTRARPQAPWARGL